MATARNPAPPIRWYFGFAVATVLIRLALTAPRVIDAALGVTATLFAIDLTRVFSRTISAAKQPGTTVEE